jgi:hypothetical protein
VSAFDNTTHTNISTTYAAGSPTVSVTFIAPTTGKAAITLGVVASDNGGVVNTVFLDREVRLTNSGGTIISATGLAEHRLEVGCTGSGNMESAVSRTAILSGLTPGSTYFVSLVHRAAVASSADVYSRRLDVVPLPA